MAHCPETPCACRTLAELREGEQAVLEGVQLDDEMAGRLMDLGFLPGSSITAGKCAPGGDPRVFRIDGADIALRRETAALVVLRAS